MSAVNINDYKEEIVQANPASNAELEEFRLKWLSKKGLLQSLFEKIKETPPEDRREFGLKVNEIKKLAEEKYQVLKEQIAAGKRKAESESLDLTLDAFPFPVGSLHPLTIVRNRMVDIFSSLGFVISEGNEIVDDWHNFTALNMPADHPARDMQDTFFIQTDPDILLRTHTSSVQVKVMQNQKPPIRTISPGRVFRKDSDATHSPVFHQVEGLFIDQNVSFADLKQTLFYFVQRMFGEGTQIRFRPSYFPFTEPSAEMDILGFKKDAATGLPVQTWIEVLGCGMVDPAVLENCGIDSEKYTGFAFGIGIERIAMVKYNIQDIRLFYENDVRFLRQFVSEI
jgi:phenylalanyl-tRNA synthetase alpha chain